MQDRSSARSTIFAHSSGLPPAAIAVIRISGPAAHQAIRTLCGSLPPARRAALRTLRAADGSLLDDALVLRFDGPASATGEDCAELHCHGGRAVVKVVLDTLGRLDGLRPAQPGEFTRRAFANGRLDLTEAEGLADLLEAETESQRRSALAVAGGEIRRLIEGWTERLVMLSARAEAAIDYVGDEDETAADEVGFAREALALREEMLGLLARPRAEVLKQGVRVVLAGPPNSGKSSLLNAIVRDERAIVTAIPGTTRDTIEVPLSLGGVPMVLVDTAGLRDSEDLVERIGVGRATTQVSRADILLWLGEAEEAPPHPRLVAIHSRADLPGRQAAPKGTLAVSAHSGLGLKQLEAVLIDRARALLPTEGSAAFNQRQADAVGEAADALGGLAPDIVITADALRRARVALDHVTGRAGVEDVLDALFGRFCLGK